MASKAQKKRLLHAQRMKAQATESKKTDPYEELKKRCSERVRERKRSGQAKRDFWKDYRERFGNWPAHDSGSDMRGSCAKKSVFDAHLFKQ